MAEVGHDRLYNVLLRRLGLKSLHGMKMSDTVQPVALVDDLSDLQHPFTGAVFSALAAIAGFAAVNSAAELQTGPTAGWLLRWDDVNTNFNRWSIGRVSQLTANIATIGAREIAAGDPVQSAAGSRARIQVGTFAPAAGIQQRAGVEWVIPIFLPPGSFVTFVNNLANDATAFTILWMEIPDL